MVCMLHKVEPLGIRIELKKTFSLLLHSVFGMPRHQRPPRDFGCRESKIFTNDSRLWPVPI